MSPPIVLSEALKDNGTGVSWRQAKKTTIARKKERKTLGEWQTAVDAKKKRTTQSNTVSGAMVNKDTQDRNHDKYQSQQ